MKLKEKQLQGCTQTTMSLSSVLAMKIVQPNTHAFLLAQDNFALVHNKKTTHHKYLFSRADS
jgi:hypothetical protein